MPLYEYQCSGCGERHEQLRRLHDSDADVECPQCHSRDNKRLLSVFASQVNGFNREAPPVPPCGDPGRSCCGGGRCGLN